MSDFLELNPGLDRQALATQFGESGYVQIRNVLTVGSAVRLGTMLTQETPWGLVSQIGSEASPMSVRADVGSEASVALQASVRRQLEQSGSAIDYAFAYFSYPLVTAYLEKWHPGSDQERLLEELNSDPFLGLLREISRDQEILKADGQATLYAPGHFLWPHTDAESARGRKVAYVLNMTSTDWRPEWGGYLNFYDSDLDIERAFVPKFNTLNIFKVPRWHSVSEVASNAPLARYAVTGWGRG